MNGGSFSARDDALRGVLAPDGLPAVGEYGGVGDVPAGNLERAFWQKLAEMETMENIEREFWQNVADLPTTPSKEEPAPAQPAPADSTPVSIVELNISAWDHTEPTSPTLPPVEIETTTLTSASFEKPNFEKPSHAFLVESAVKLNHAAWVIQKTVRARKQKAVIKQMAQIEIQFGKVMKQINSWGELRRECEFQYWQWTHRKGGLSVSEFEYGKVMRDIHASEEDGTGTIYSIRDVEFKFPNFEYFESGILTPLIVIQPSSDFVWHFDESTRSAHQQKSWCPPWIKEVMRLRVMRSRQKAASPVSKPGARLTGIYWLSGIDANSDTVRRAFIAQEHDDDHYLRKSTTTSKSFPTTMSSVDYLLINEDTAPTEGLKPKPDEDTSERGGASPPNAIAGDKPEVETATTASAPVYYGRPISTTPMYEERRERAFIHGDHRVVLSGQRSYARIGEVDRVGQTFDYPAQEAYSGYFHEAERDNNDDESNDQLLLQEYEEPDDEYGDYFDDTPDDNYFSD